MSISKANKLPKLVGSPHAKPNIKWIRLYTFKNHSLIVIFIEHEILFIIHFILFYGIFDLQFILEHHPYIKFCSFLSSWKLIWVGLALGPLLSRPNLAPLRPNGIQP